MLKIKHNIQESKIHGLGLFTEEDLEEGLIIGSLNKFDIQIPINEVDIKDIYFFDFYFSKQGEVYQTYFDNMRFMNHSNTPNCIDLKNGDCVTLKKIKKGEELTCDYHLICDNWEK
jgi:SET domain-containing protein